MSLGVLNNLSAMYAANNLNNTNNSLSKTLQQLSSGSKINSGSDDAAGLSLISGLQANATALTQSQTNAQEGVGLLQVADGALSQVTNLLNRAVTLATESSNGTLTGSQLSAANQEYQSILSEISNIGSTTTYNQQQVFNTTTNIYTGDSSTQGASITQLNIRGLSASNVGDSSGTMAYTSGSGNGDVFIDLAKGATNAALGNVLNVGGTTTLVVNTLSGSGSVVANNITVGGTSGYANTVQGMISAINNSGLGLTASFTTAAVAGDSAAAAAGDKGIMIQGSVGVGTSPTNTSYSGSATVTGAANNDVLSGSITLQVGSNSAQTITMAQVAAASSKTAGNVTLDDLVNYINANTSLGVTANDTAAGKIALQSSAASNPQLKVTMNLTDNSLASGPAALTYTASNPYADGISTGTFATTGMTDSSTGQLIGDATIHLGTATTSSGVATISYSDKAGQSLSGTDLTNQSNAQAALTALNAAISNVAAQDGYIGAMINTLNSVSSVISTQQQNIVAAQNAVQATDYATAASNMSKYQILSQTGISALAQANSVQQEVLKLLQ